MGCGVAWLPITSEGVPPPRGTLQTLPLVVPVPQYTFAESMVRQALSPTVGGVPASVPMSGQTPLPHLVLQTTPQPPQFCGSFAVSTQVPAQRVPPPSHAGPAASAPASPLLDPEPLDDEVPLLNPEPLDDEVPLLNPEPLDDEVPLLDPEPLDDEVPLPDPEPLDDEPPLES